MIAGFMVREGGPAHLDRVIPMRGINARLGYVISPVPIEVEKLFAP